MTRAGRALLAVVLVMPFAAFGVAAGLTWTLRGPEGLAVAFGVLAGVWVGVLAAGLAVFVSGPRGAHYGGPKPELDPLPGNVRVLAPEREYTIPAPHSRWPVPPVELGPRPASWGKYPAPHWDDEGTCQCPDHVAMRCREWDSM